MALLPPNFLKTVVSIEVSDEKGTYNTVGTGFLYAQTLSKEGDEYSVYLYLVTARHVIYRQNLSQKAQLQSISLRFDSLGDIKNKVFSIPLYGKKGFATFACSPDGEDVAVIKLDVNALKLQELDYVPIIDIETALASDRFQEEGLAMGDEVYFLGFPLGLKGRERNYAICRRGTIARLDQETLKDNVMYLDAPVFPGNSGGPVFCKPQIVSIQGTIAVKKAYLIGLAVSFLNSDKCSLASLSQEELLEHLKGHLGLSKIVTVDAIKKAITELEKQIEQW